LKLLLKRGRQQQQQQQQQEQLQQQQEQLHLLTELYNHSEAEEKRKGLQEQVL
jgi:hypothetical protein